MAGAQAGVSNAKGITKGPLKNDWKGSGVNNPKKKKKHFPFVWARIELDARYVPSSNILYEQAPTLTEPSLSTHHGFNQLGVAQPANPGRKMAGPRKMSSKEGITR
jgi:hypothetical protein